MSYTPTSWSTGDTITAAAMNKIENGIANAGGGDILYDIGVEDGTLDKTWTEIYTAHSGGKIVRIVQGAEGFAETQYVIATVSDNGTYFVYFAGGGAAWYQTSSANGYPEYFED